MTWILKDKPVDLTRLVMSQREMTLWSPTRGKRPVPSSMLIDDPPLCSGQAEDRALDHYRLFRDTLTMRRN